MRKYNPENERIKRQYFAYLKEAKQYSEQTLDVAAKALSRFEECNRHRGFNAFHFEQAISFKRNLAEQTGRRSGEKLSRATLHATLKQLRAFFFWLAGQPGYKARLQYSDAEYFNLSERDTRIAMAQRERKSPTMEQMHHVIESMPEGSEIERRNRALLAFVFLTGARDSAVASIKLKHLDLKDGFVYQDASEVRTKFGKTFTTFFLPVGGIVREIVVDWVRYLREEKLWGDDDPLFPATRIVLGATRQFEAAGLERTCWSTAAPIRTIFREAFESAGLPYFNPHSLRKTLVRLGLQVCQSPEDLKAWSQNLGHEQVLTTLMSYGKVPTDRQGEIIRGMGTSKAQAQPAAVEMTKAIIEGLRSAGATLPSGQ